MENKEYQINEIRTGKEIGIYNCSGKKYQYLSCPDCGTVRWVRFYKGKPLNFYCRICAGKRRVVIITRICAGCGKPFQVHPYKPKRFCGRSCAIINRNVNHTGVPRKKHKVSVGQKYGLLTITNRSNKIDKWHSVYWDCTCECGGLNAVSTHNLVTGAIRSCGCLRGHTHMLPPGVSSMRKIYGGYLAKARKTNMEFDLSINEFRDITQQPCFYCGHLPSNKGQTIGYNGTFIYNGLDRVDNSKGYVTGNVVPCCRDCNFSKNTRTQQEFYLWIKRVSRHFKPASVNLI